jgi:hypothetical protein
MVDMLVLSTPKCEGILSFEMLLECACFLYSVCATAIDLGM